MGKLTIHNVRIGLATNSSSSHSFIIIPNGADGRPFYSDGYPLGGEFGWDQFTLDTTKEKRDYLGQALSDSFLRIMPPEIADVFMYGLLGGKTGYEEGYIDHQSFPVFPNYYYNKAYPDLEFLTAFRDWLFGKDVVILGGNDNDGQHPLATGSQFKWFYDDEAYVGTDLVARHDPRYGYWTLFNRDGGAKVRFSFDTWGRENEAPITRAFAPELVDMKITDQCPFGCKFCYQGSTPDGGHGDYDDIVFTLKALSKLKVFEVAIGGGEPTLHPQFTAILKYAREVGIVPNFTTRNMAWLKKPAMVRDVMAYAGAFAVSIHEAHEIEKLAALLSEAEIDTRRVNLHVVMGTVTRDEFTQIIMASNTHDFRVTLLGYKTAGFGANVTPIAYDWWVDVLKSIGKYRISIDTVLAAQYEDALKAAGIPSWMYHTKDGTFSAYVDAVALKFGAASYIDPSELIDLPESLWSVDRVVTFIKNKFSTFSDTEA